MRSPHVDRVIILVATMLLAGWAVLAFIEGLTWWNLLSVVGVLLVGSPSLHREISRRHHARPDGGSSEAPSA